MNAFDQQVDFVDQALKNASKVLENANIGLTKDTLYKIVVFKSQEMADSVRSQVDKTGRSLLAIEDLDENKRSDIKETIAMSSNVAIINLIQIGGEPSSNKGKYAKPLSTLQKRSIREIPIILSMDEVFSHNQYLVSMANLKFPWSFVLDASVPMVNQIMFTFNRQDMNVLNMVTKEVWQWQTKTFKLVSPNFTYDYNSSFIKMIVFEILNRFSKLVSLFIGFGVISMVNGLLIRVAIKCSLLTIFPLLRLNEIIHGRVSNSNRRHVYEQMGG